MMEESKIKRERKRDMVSTETDRQDFAERSYATGCCHGDAKGGRRQSVVSFYTELTLFFTALV